MEYTPGFHDPAGRPHEEDTEPEEIDNDQEPEEITFADGMGRLDRVLARLRDLVRG
jgi:hypothetical protein